MKRRLLLVAAIVGLVTVGVMVLQGFAQERQYRQLLVVGELALRSGQTYAAIEAFSGALALRPDSMVAHFRRGEAYANQGQDDSSVRDLREASRLAPDAPQPLVALGDLYDKRGEHAKAAEWYSQAAMRLQDADPRLLYSLALAHYRAGAPAAAKIPLRRALARDASVPEAHYLLGLVSRDAGDVDAAVASLEQAVRLSPALVSAREELADLYREREYDEGEMRQLAELAGVDPQTDRLIAIALADVHHGRFDNALRRLHDLARDAPTDSQIQLAIGRAHLANAERTGSRTAVTSALAALERALGGTASRSEGLALFGRALYVSGDLTGAERILREAIATSPVEPEAFAFLADAAERLSHAEAASDALVKLDALQGDTVSSMVRAARAQRIGTLKLSAGDPRMAVTFLTQAIDTGLGTANTLGLLARARWQIGDQQGAREALGQALALDSLDPDLRRLRRTFN